MCQGDMSLYSYKWLPTQDMPKPLTQMDHVCIDWDKMMDWAAERSFSLYDGLLTSPYSGQHFGSHHVIEYYEALLTWIDTPWVPTKH